jgi:hypothetical protein
MSDLKIDDDLLDGLKSGLADVRDQLNRSSSFAAEIAALVGDDHLADRVNAFSSQWKDHRTKMIDAITTVHDHVATIDEKFTQVDHKLSSALEKKG